MSAAEAAATRFARLTPAGKGAIASFALQGPAALDLARELMQPFGRLSTFLKFLDDAAQGYLSDRFWVGKLQIAQDSMGEEVVVAVRTHGALPRVEIHSHGGSAIASLMEEAFAARGVQVCAWPDLLRDAKMSPLSVDALQALSHATTARTAAILLDQYHGALASAIEQVLVHLQHSQFEQAGAALGALARWTGLGRHLIEPWRVAVLGAPNVGKSSLINGMAGFQRSVVAPTPGTTRDVVTARIAVDGWPIELIDTAGLRADAESLEHQGIELALAAAARADLCLWVLDGAAPPVWPASGMQPRSIMHIVNKIDLPPAWDSTAAPGAVCVSAATGAGLEVLLHALAHALVPEAPAPGAAVPFTPELCRAIAAAHAAGRAGQWEEAVQLLIPLRDAAPGSESRATS